MMLCVEGIWRIFEDRLPIVVYTAHLLLLPGESERCVPSEMKIEGPSVSPTLSIDETLISTLLSCSITSYLCLPAPPVRGVHFGIEAFQ